MIKAAGILFVADGKVLLLKRSATSSHGKEWALPGGGVEGSETPEQAARREFSEECGYTYTGELSPIMTTNDGQVEYTTFIARCDSFQPKLNEEHTAFLWADIDDYPNKTHPAVKALLDTDKARDEIISSAALDCRADAAEVVTELDIAKKIRDGVLTSPQQYKNISIFALRISGTGISYRAKLDEYVNRLPENYLSEEFLQRCNGLPVIWVHPPKNGRLDTESFADRVVGTICLPYIAGDEVWGIAKIWDATAAKEMQDVQLSTSPMVSFEPGTNNKVKLNDGSHVLIEGKPSLVDHLAIVENGVWDKDGEPSGVLVETAQVVMTEASMMDSTDSSCSTLGEASMADNEKPVATEPTNPAETEMLALIRQIAGDQKGIMTRLEALEAAEAAEVAAAAPVAAPAAAVPDAAPAAVAASPAANMPAPVLPVNQAAAKPDAATEPTVSKKDFDEVKGRLDSVAAALEQTKSDAEPEKEKAFADAQGRLDEVEQMYGDSAPRKLAGDTVMSYEKRHVMKHLPRSKRWSGTNIEAIADPVIFAKIRDEVYADSMKAATSCEGIAAGQVRAVTKTEGGCTTTKFLGKDSFTKAHTMRAM